jgi:hypothetical protein
MWGFFIALFGWPGIKWNADKLGLNLLTILAFEALTLIVIYLLLKSF